MKKLLTTLCIMLMLVALICVPAYAAGGDGSGGGTGGGTGGGGGNNNPLSFVSAQVENTDLAGAELAAGEVVVTVTFDRGMTDNFDANKECIKVLNASAEEVEYAIENPTKSVYVLTFEATEGEYSLVLGADIKANNGNTLGDEKKIGFTVKAAEPTEPTEPIAPIEPSKPAFDKCNKDDSCPIAVFSDADAKAWYHDGVHYCLDNELMKGTGTDTFTPQGSITRAMIVTIIYRQAGIPAAEAENPFADVAEGQWYADAVAWAAANDIVKGVSDTEFAPDQNVTREQFAAILFRYASYKEMGTNKRADLSGYTDLSEASDWALEALQWCNGKNLITGLSDTTLAPAANATRAQAATIFMRFCQLAAE